MLRLDGYGYGLGGYGGGYGLGGDDLGYGPDWAPPIGDDALRRDDWQRREDSRRQHMNAQ